MKGIQSLHSFTMQNGGILTSQLSCHQCTVASKCSVCKKMDPSVSKEDVEAALKEQLISLEDSGLDKEEDDEAETAFVDSDSGSEDDVWSDSGEEESEEEEDDNEPDLSDPGSFVWVLWGGRRYPAKVVLMAEVPADLRKSLRKDDGKSVVVKFYGDDDFSRVDLRKVTVLGQTNLDLRWSRFSGVLEKYNVALADLRYSG